jgi:hypothetical protein
MSLCLSYYCVVMVMETFQLAVKDRGFVRDEGNQSGTRMEVGYDTSIVSLRVIRGDRKGNQYQMRQ